MVLKSKEKRKHLKNGGLDSQQKKKNIIIFTLFVVCIGKKRGLPPQI